ncbi:peroxiredoxin [candidate division KSB1 bacterium]
MNMSFLVQKEAPDFTAQAVMPDNSFEELTLSSYRGKYITLFFYPMDFTSVCSSEVVAFNKELDKFKSRNCEVIGVSADSHFSHRAWKNTPLEGGGIGDIGFPMVSDKTQSISRSFGVLTEAGIALRGSFLIDKEGIVRHAVVNDTTLGRNIDEALRILDSLQFTETHGEGCPANWRQEE